VLKPVAVALAVASVSVACATPDTRPPLETGLQAIASAISETMRAHHYDPAVLASAEYAALEQRVDALAASAPSTEEFITGFNAIWGDGPFSHVDLQVGQASAADTAATLDTIRVGGDGARLSWDDDIAVLTVTTMMGLDTIEQIEAAYAEVDRRGARALIIDLRENRGGAFAIRPLVGHAIETPLDAGVFVSQGWAAERGGYPTREETEEVEPWEGWSIVRFWRDAQKNRFTRVQFAPLSPTYGGPIYVLVGKRTASVAELASDALQASGRASLIGETTAGEMLSQKMYDLPQGLLLSLPIADYYAFHSGRIEGTGVTPDVRSEAESAMGIALGRARQ
jgi:C-terminal processing protease CtpA/Prc